MNTSDKTTVIGYYNPNPYPMSLHVSELGLSINLKSKQYITVNKDLVNPKTGAVEKMPVKVNDPIFENYTGPGKLGKEVGKTSIPFVILPRPQLQQAPVNRADISGRTKFRTDHNGKIIESAESLAPTPPEKAPPESASHVMGLTIEEAVRLKIIPPPIGWTSESAKQAEKKEAAKPKSLAEVRQIRKKAFEAAGIDDTPATAAAAAPSGGVDMATASAVPTLESLAPQQGIDEDDSGEEAQDLGSITSQVAKAAGAIPQAPPPAKVEAAQPELPSDLPDPDLGSAEESKPAAPSEKDARREQARKERAEARELARQKKKAEREAAKAAAKASKEAQPAA